MPMPKVFISSTFNDLSEIRNQISVFLREYGFDPILSENSDIFYSPDDTAINSCLKSARESDLCILIIGSRYGSINNDNGLSIVHSEYESAYKAGVPVFTFIKKDVLNGLSFFNSNKEFINKGLTIPGLDSSVDAIKIFSFVNSIMDKQKNNAIFDFENFENIKESLKKQFAAYFLRTISNKSNNYKRAALSISTYHMEYDLNEVSIKINLSKKVYEIEFHKKLKNISGKPISQVLFHYLSNVYPENPEKSYKHYLANPVFWKDLNVKAWDIDRSLDIRLINDHGSRKDFLIIFGRDGIDFPILQNENREFWYKYDVPFILWGPYIDRPITFPTKKCTVNIQYPSALNINAGGFQISPFRPKIHLENKIERINKGDDSFIKWSSEDLSIGDTYQIYWNDFMNLGHSKTNIITTNQNHAKQ